MLQRHISISMYNSQSTSHQPNESYGIKNYLSFFHGNIQNDSVNAIHEHCTPHKMHGIHCKISAYLQLTFHVFPRILILRRRYFKNSINLAFVIKCIFPEENSTNYQSFPRRISSFHVCHQF